MKVTAESEKIFQSISLTIEIESQSELEWYKALFGLEQKDLRDIYLNREFHPNVRILTDPDTMGNVLDVLDKY